MKKIVLSMASVALLTACAKEEKTPYVSYDTKWKAAKLKPEKKPVRIVKVPKVLPMPGQLKKLPSPRKENGKRKNPIPVSKRIAMANKLARVEPTKEGFINAVQVWPFTEEALFQVYCAPNTHTVIKLQPGEKLRSLVAGDTTRWVVTDTRSGAGANERVLINVKPIKAGLSTNMSINTDRRSYGLELHSREKVYMSKVRFVYPQDELIALRKANARAAVQQAVSKDIDVSNLQFRYRIKGDAPWKPRQVFDDGKKVYIKFPSGVKHGAMPPLFVKGYGGKLSLVNYRSAGAHSPYYIVDRLFAAAELRYGKPPQDVVRITRRDVRYK